MEVIVFSIIEEVEVDNFERKSVFKQINGTAIDAVSLEEYLYENKQIDAFLMKVQ